MKELFLIPVLRLFEYLRWCETNMRFIFRWARHNCRAFVRHYHKPLFLFSQHSSWLSLSVMCSYVTWWPVLSHAASIMSVCRCGPFRKMGKNWKLCSAVSLWTTFTVLLAGRGTAAGIQECVFYPHLLLHGERWLFKLLLSVISHALACAESLGSGWFCNLRPAGLLIGLSLHSAACVVGCQDH